MRLAFLGTIIGAAAVQVLAGFTPSHAAERRLPVPAITIYPGDIIRDSMLTERDFPEAVVATGYLDRRSDLVGKASKRTLLPGQAITTNSVALPKLVTIGAMVRLVFEEGGLNISTYASALQAGAAGDLITVRNLESGLTLSGVIAADGSIHVSNG